MDESKTRFVRSTLLRWGRRNKREFPWRETEDPYQVLIAEILLHQTFARKVVPVYEELLRRHPTVASLAKTNPAKIREILRPLGFLYRANDLVEIAKVIAAEHNGEIPADAKELEKLKGVGPYTASAVLCFGFDQPIAIVDTNVLRVYRRFFWTMAHSTKAGPDKKTVEIAQATLSVRKPREFNWAILDFAAAVCTHYNPSCVTCPLLRLCEFGQARLVAEQT